MSLQITLTPQHHMCLVLSVDCGVPLGGISIPAVSSTEQIL